jgi:hypothetical protein
VLSRPELGAELELVETELLGQLAAQGLFSVLVLVDAASRRRPPNLTALIAELDEERSGLFVHDQRSRGCAICRLEPRLERAEPFEPLCVPDRRVRW